MTSNPSRWTEIVTEEGAVGTLWTDNNVVGFTASGADVNSAFIQRLSKLVEASNTLDIPADRAFNAVFSSIQESDNFVAIMSEGTPEQLYPVIAAGLAGDEINEPSPYSITVDEDGNVIGLANTSGGEVTVRQNGKWVQLTDEEDPRFFGNEIHYVSENAVEIYDKLEGSGPSNKSAYNEVSLD